MVHGIILIFREKEDDLEEKVGKNENYSGDNIIYRMKKKISCIHILKCSSIYIIKWLFQQKVNFSFSKTSLVAIEINMIQIAEIY